MKRRFFNFLLVAAIAAVTGDVISSDTRSGLKSSDIGHDQPMPAPPNHHFRSKSSGLWTDPSNWESSPDSVAWSNSTLHPTHEAASVTINNGHIIEINTPVTILNTFAHGELTLTTGGRIKIGSGNGTGITVKNTGRFRVATSDDYSDAIEIPQLSEPGFYPLHVQSGGTVVIEKPSGENSGKGFETLATHPDNRWDHRSNFIWNNGVVFPTNASYFPSSPPSEIPVFTVGPREIPEITSAGVLNINGLLNIRTPVHFAAATGQRTFRDGITGNDTLKIAAGTQNISGPQAVLGGSGLTIVLGKQLNFNTSGMTVTVPKDSSVTFLGEGKVIHKESDVRFIINGTADITTVNMDNTSGYVEVNGHLKTAAPSGLLGSSTATVTSGDILINEGSTVEYNSEADQDITSSAVLKGSSPYYHIIFSGSGIKTPKSTIKVHNNGSVTITGSPVVDASGNNLGPPDADNLAAFKMDGGRLILGTLGYTGSGTQPLMKGDYDISGGTIAFTGGTPSESQTIRSNNYLNIEVGGSNVGNSNGNIGIKSNGTFTIKPGGIYTSTSGNASIEGVNGSGQSFRMETGSILRTSVREGFYGVAGSSGNSPTVRNSIPVVDLHEGSKIEYNRNLPGGNQNISFHSGVYEYQQLSLSGNGKKTAPASDLVIKGDFIRTGDAVFIHNNGKLIFNNNEIQKVDAGNSLFFDLENRNSNALKIESDLRIHHSLKLSEHSKLHLNTGDIVIVSDTERTARIAPIPDNATITFEDTGGRFVVERYIPKHSKAWQLLSVPTKGSTIKQTWQDNQTINSQRGVLITGPVYTSTDTKGFDGYSPSPSMKYLNPATGLFKAITTTDNLINDQTAYFLFVRGDRSVDGKMNVIPTGVTLYTRGKLFSPGTEAPEEISISANQWTMVGNPYASAVDFEKLSFAAGVLPGYYIWDPQLTNPTYSEYGLGGYRHITQLGDGAYTAVPDGGNYPSVSAPMIQSGQAFFVYSSSENTLRFAESAKTTESINVFRKMPRNEAFSGIRTNLYTKKNNDTILLDGTLHLFSEEYSEDIDQFDAPKLFNSGENIALHTSPNHLIVERRPYPTETDTLFYALTGTNKRNYLLHFSFYGNIFEEQKVYLNDSYRQISTHLAGKNNEVNFEVDGNPASSSPGRFYLTFQKVVHPFSFHNEKVTVAKNAIIISWQSTNEAAVKEYHVEYSYDGYYFMALQSIALSKMKESTYQAIHNNPDAGIIHHRIKAIMENGDTVYSKLLTSTYQERLPLITTYPNPAKEFLFVNLHSPQGGKYRIRLLNSEGRVILAKTVHHQGFPMKTKVDVSYLQDGIYEVQLINPDGTIESRRIVIE